MKLPFFNYPQLVQDAKNRDGLDVENSMLMLHFLEMQQLCELSERMLKALSNFELWKKLFLSVNEAEFKKRGIEEMAEHFEAYTQMLSKCILRAEFYNWRIFERPEYFNMQPILSWGKNEILFTRSLRRLL